MWKRPRRLGDGGYVVMHTWSVSPHSRHSEFRLTFKKGYDEPTLDRLLSLQVPYHTVAKLLFNLKHFLLYHVSNIKVYSECCREECCREELWLLPQGWEIKGLSDRTFVWHSLSIGTSGSFHLRLRGKVCYFSDCRRADTLVLLLGLSISLLEFGTFNPVSSCSLSTMHCVNLCVLFGLKLLLRDIYASHI